MYYYIKYDNYNNIIIWYYDMYRILKYSFQGIRYFNDINKKLYKFSNYTLFIFDV